MTLVDIPDECPECEGVSFRVTFWIDEKTYRTRCIRCREKFAWKEEPVQQ